MNPINTKTTAEAILRDLPSVLGAYVSEDLEGYPREIHILVEDGPDTGQLARHVRTLLQDRLGIPIDQRVISIAQLAPEPVELDEPPLLQAIRGGSGQEVEEVDRGSADRRTDRPGEPEVVRSEGRPIFSSLESTLASGRVAVSVRLQWKQRVSEGTGEAVDTMPGRARAAATATLEAAATAEWTRALKLELDFASIVRALDGEYVLVSVLGISTRPSRKPLPLVGAHPVDGDTETAAALATLKAINRILERSLESGD